MSAIVVQCPSCQARFHLAQERIPEKGARVRCSRCEHRFYVTATGDVSESRPRKGKEADAESGAQSGAQSRSQSGSASSASSSKALLLSPDDASQPRGRKAPEAATTAMDAMREPPAKPARPRALGAVAPREDADLDDPQFLFDETASSEELPYKPGAQEEGVSAFDAPDHEEPSSEAFGDAPGRPITSLSPDTDVTPHPPAEVSEPASQSAEADGSWLSNDDEAIPDIRAQRDELVAQHSSAARAEPPDDGDFEVSGNQVPEGFEARTPQPTPSASRVDPGRPVAREASRSVETQSRYAGAASPTLITRTARGGARPSAPLAGPLSASLERVATLLGVLVALALIFAGGRALLVQQLRLPLGPERVHLERGEVSGVEVLHLHDAEGHRVLAVRGLLSSSGSEPLRVQLQLIDASGNPVGSPHVAHLELLRDADLETEKLAELLVPAEPAPAAASGARGFTVLIRAPPLEAERFVLELAG